MRNKIEIFRSKKGFSVLDILIVVLIVAVLAALIIPKMKKDQKAADQSLARERMLVIAGEMDKYFQTAGYTIDPDAPVKETVDSLVEKTETEEAESDSLPKIVRIYTDDFTKLQLPEDFRPVSPPNDKEFKLFVRDSSYYVIYDPNGHGTVLNGEGLWEAD